MSKFLTTHATAYHIEEIMISANEELVLVSPYLQLSTTFFTRLKDADRRGVKIYLIYGKKQLKEEEESQLIGLKNLTRYFCKDLHAKCYFNEETMVITSMNMYEFSEKNNREMGILITKEEEDSHSFSDAVKEVKSILQSSTVDEDIHSNRTTSVPATTKKAYSPKTKSRPQAAVESKQKNPLLSALSALISGEQQDGYCIRCRDRIPADSFYPMCDKCYSSWAKYKNPEYAEKYCHICGKERKTSKDKPLCLPCFKAS